MQAGQFSLLDGRPIGPLSIGLDRLRSRLDVIGVIEGLSTGRQGAQVTVMQVTRSDPDTIEFSITLDLLAVVQTPFTVQGQLGYDDALNLAGLPITYRPDIAPGLF